MSEPVMAAALARPGESPADALRRLRSSSALDGLPALPPGRADVLAFLEQGAPGAAEQPATVLAGTAAITGFDVAACALLAGCEPQHLPLLLAAVRALAEPRLHLNALLERGDPAALALIVSGAAAERLGIGDGTMRTAAWPSAALARALSLVVRNACRAAGRPKASDALGDGLCVAEAAADSPWPGLAAERGLPGSAAAATVFLTSGLVPLTLPEPAGADEILQTLARSMTVATVAEDQGLIGGGEPLLVLSTKLAQRLQQEGFDCGGTRRELWRRARLRLRDLAAATRERVEAARRARGESDVDGALPVAKRSGDISLVVAQSDGLRALYLPGWHGGTRSATLEVT